MMCYQQKLRNRTFTKSMIYKERRRLDNSISGDSIL